MIEFLLVIPILILLVIAGALLYLIGGFVAIAIMFVIDTRESKKFRIHTEWQAGEYILGFVLSWFTVFSMLFPVKNTLL